MRQINRKKFLYEVDPLFFYDSNNDGFGDFKGFLDKIEYFINLKINGVIFPDIFNQESIILKNVNVTLFNKYGNIAELKKIISIFEENQIDLLVEINIDNILNSMLTKTTLEDIKLKDIQQFIEVEEGIKENNLSWNTSKRIEAFSKVINFWHKLGVSNFVFTHFEHIYEKNNSLDTKLINQLELLYKNVKEINRDASIGLKTIYFNSATINLIFKDYLNKMCDFVIDSSYSLIATDKKFNFSISKPFNHNNVLKKIKNIKINQELFGRYFISFNNNNIGRINSRWLNENNLIDESNKCLLTITNLLPYSTVNYYGDELGLLHLNIKDKDEYQDYGYNEKKREAEAHKFKVSDFEQSQKLLSRINSQSVFIWNDQLNGGFSQAKQIFRKLPINYKTHNVAIEEKDNQSIFSYYKHLIEISNEYITNANYAQESANDVHIKLHKKLFTITLNKNQQKKLIIINLSNKSINKSIKMKNWKVILTNFPNKSYSHNIKVICPYEAIVLVRK